MIKNRSTTELVAIASNGGGLALDASQHSVQELTAIASNMQAGAQLILRNTGQLSISEMTTIAANGHQTVLFAD